MGSGFEEWTLLLWYLESADSLEQMCLFQCIPQVLFTFLDVAKEQRVASSNCASKAHRKNGNLVSPGLHLLDVCARVQSPFTTLQRSFQGRLPHGLSKLGKHCPSASLTATQQAALWPRQKNMPGPEIILGDNLYNSLPGKLPLSVTLSVVQY